MTQPPWVPPTEAQWQTADKISQLIIAALTTDRGIHAETAIASAGRLGGTFLFRSFGIKTDGVKPGTAVLSDLANEHGPLLVQTFGTALGRLGVSLDQSALSKPIPTDNAPQLSLLQTTAALEAPATTLAQRYQLDQPASAHACAIAAAILIQKAQSVLDPGVGAAIAVYGFVEGSKTMPPPLSGSAQP
ncbi:MAG TPA: hypothetical protein VLB12_18075 [Gemmatimonadales bacterium]|nr:hypothetical protein [Gemmatimonadales bacterium]